MKRIPLAILIGMTLSVLAAPKPPPPPAIVSSGRAGLTYDQDGSGNRVPDFSSCGYAGANKEIPTAPVRIVVSPVPGDATERIQRAIDYVSGLPLDTNGLRGAVLLLKGRHEVLGGLQITNSGVVLRGQGMGASGTVLFAGGLDRRTVIRVLGQDDGKVVTNASWQITDDYVPVGAASFTVRKVAGLKAGDAIRVVRPSPQAWIEQVGAMEFGGGEGARWKPGSQDIVWNRTIKSIAGNQITVDAPLTTALEKKLGGGGVQTYAWPGCSANVGIENLTLESAFDPANPKDENHAWFGITMENAADCWVRQVTFQHFAGSAVALYESCRRVTVEDCLSLAPVSEAGGYRRNTFFTMGQQTLFLRCYAENGRHDFSTGHCAAGPNAFVQCEASLPTADSGGIESWSSGTLFDNVRIDGNAITLGYRPGNNAAIGWAAANSVLWNCSASVIRCWNPPGAQNWSFGSWASFEGDGHWRSSNNFMSPDSLFAAQLKARLGDAAPRLILMPRPRDESSNPSVERAQELAAASHKPAPQLKDFILAASQRNPIPGQVGDARRVEQLPAPRPPPARQKTALSITNGWLVMDGRLLTGKQSGVAWWRGNIRPDEGESFGPALTRYAPGRMGRGLTDDFGEVLAWMQASNAVALDHNYGLWYDRRRDDHERVRRINGDVLPPFFEQPFARSGQGTAWDGLSQYDLTRFNPWYWSRLQQFATIADARGLVLFHQNYFQHNILEAGAHWADFPWRSANNINGTGFPEPPPYAGDKRIFQAELFYDVAHPVRRKLHEGYIRQCLDNFTNNVNVIQFTSAEFTGPLHFMQFWLDTVAAWERAHCSSRREEALTSLASKKNEPPHFVGDEVHGSGECGPLIALSATKDVQDAILADAPRRAVVDVIDFRYWWRTDAGEYAPPGGKNLAPRQFERQRHGGRPNEANLANMAAEYRAKFPGKALICDFDSAGWAWLCAGGSMPRLPRTTDAKLLAAIPRMKPVGELSGDGRWVLGEPGKQVLVYRRGNAELDLSAESGAFRVNRVNPRTGEVTPGEKIQAGGKVQLPAAAIVWLTKE